MFVGNAGLLKDDCDCCESCCELISEIVTLVDPIDNTSCSSLDEGVWSFGRQDINHGATANRFGEVYNPRLCWRGTSLSIWIEPPVIRACDLIYFFKLMRITWGCNGEFTTGWIRSRAYTINLPACIPPERCTIALEAIYERRPSTGGLSCSSCAFDSDDPIWEEFPLVALLDPDPVFGLSNTGGSPLELCRRRVFDDILQPLIESSLVLPIGIGRICVFEGVIRTDVNVTFQMPCWTYNGSEVGTGHAWTTARISVGLWWSAGVLTFLSYTLSATANKRINLGNSTAIISSIERAVGSGFLTVNVNEVVEPVWTQEEFCAAVLEFCAGKSGTSPQPNPDGFFVGSISVRIV